MRFYLESCTFPKSGCGCRTNLVYTCHPNLRFNQEPLWEEINCLTVPKSFSCHATTVTERWTKEILSVRNQATHRYSEKFKLRL